MKQGVASGSTLTYNWDGKLRSATCGTDTVDLRYDPQGGRIYKETDNGSTAVKRKYIIDIVGDLPVILLELEEIDEVDIVRHTLAMPALDRRPPGRIRDGHPVRLPVLEHAREALASRQPGHVGSPAPPRAA